ncbi:MAG TPA: DUF222 domain-containing protein [Steroidobacteraceae bacterium]|nr:DUF222 domain-containing protein [Steroidobacteraceae bacterium]
MDGSSPEPNRFYAWPEISPEEQALRALETELFELWGHLNAATYRFLVLVAEFDRREGWARHGVASCAQWLSWQCGIGRVAAREKVRVARALEALPRISDSFRHGIVSYSKVRAMTRIATPDNEATLLMIAEHGTAAHVEKLVRKYCWVERLEDAQRANGTHFSRYLRYSYDEDGSMLLHAKLPAEVGALVRKAIETAVNLAEPDPAGPDVSAEASEREPFTVNDGYGAKRADALRLLADSFLAQQTAAAGAVSDRYQVVVHIDQRALTVGNVAHPEPAADEDRGVSPPRCELEDETGAERALAVETARRLGCDCSLVGIIESQDGEPLNVGRKSRSISPALQRALKSRDGGCRFPGCDRTRFTEGHHVQHWADGGETKLANLVTLCTLCGAPHNVHYADRQIMPRDQGAASPTRGPSTLNGFCQAA